MEFYELTIVDNKITKIELIFNKFSFYNYFCFHKIAPKIQNQ